MGWWGSLSSACERLADMAKVAPFSDREREIGNLLLGLLTCELGDYAELREMCPKAVRGLKAIGFDLDCGGEDGQD